MTLLNWRSKLTCDDAAPVGGAGRRPANSSQWAQSSRRQKADIRDSISDGDRDEEMVLLKTLVKQNFFNGLAAVVLVLAGVVSATGGAA